MERGNQYLKSIDRYAGIPLLWLLGLFRRKQRQIPARINRIAIIKGAAIGDTVLLSAIIQDIRLQYPNTKIVFFCGQTCYDTAKLIPSIDQVVLIPTTKPFETISILRRAGRFDLVIDAGPWTRLEALFTYFAKSDYTIGFHSLNQHRHFAHDEPVDHSNQQHEVENNRNLIRSFVKNPSHRPTLQIPSVDFAALLKKTGLNRPYFILHPWSGGYKGHYKEWMPERWIDLAEWLVKQGYHVAFSGAKTDRDRTSALVEACLVRSVPALNLAGQTSLLEIIAIVKEAEGVVSVNTGILHIAAAVGAPVVGINGPVPTRRWGAVSDRAVNIDAQGSACGYIHLGFEYPSSPPDCMNSIQVDNVKAGISTLLITRVT